MIADLEDLLQICERVNRVSFRELTRKSGIRQEEEQGADGPKIPHLSQSWYVAHPALQTRRSSFDWRCDGRSQGGSKKHFSSEKIGE
jgi:hypothetical protein